MKQKIELGDRVKDIVTGFTGIVVCHTRWLNKCVRLGVQPQDLSTDKKPVEMQVFDEEQLLIVAKNVVSIDKDQTGGPMPNVTQHAIPRRR